MISRFFINRPVFATVLSIVIVLAGLAAMRSLPVAQYPQIVPPEVVVSASYPGASAETISEAVAAPLEQEINGVDNMIYMTSSSADSGALSLSVTFDIGTDPDQATIDVNNRVQSAMSSLPESVRRQGVSVEKRSTNILSVITLGDQSGRHDTVFLSNYALLNVIDELKRLPGVGDASLFGAQDYAMRVELQPDKLADYGLTPSDVAAALREQNAQFAAGKFGAEPNGGDSPFTYTVTTRGRFSDVEEFESIILRAGDDAATLRLGDVADVYLGAQDYGTAARHNASPAVPIGVYLQPGANALETAAAVEAKMDELAGAFPEGMSYAVPYDTTKFVDASVHEVIKTFVEALVLVVAVVFLFLQNVRATVIPLLAVPVSLIGTFAGMYVLGFSINLFTLFGMVLAIGIVVDDAIIVLENVERLMTDEGLPPRQAALKAMEEVSGPVIAVVLVLCAVFVPVGFLGGLAGELYTQFAITIAVSVTISGIVALTLTPALCALMLKPGAHRPALPFRWFNRAFDRVTGGYLAGVRFLTRRRAVGLVLFAGLIGVTVLLFQRVPAGLVPQEDQGTVFAMTYLPPAASLDRTRSATNKLIAGVRDLDAVEDVVSVAGYDLIAGAQRTYAATSFISLKDWAQRPGAGESAGAIARQVMGIGAGVSEANVFAFLPPPIMGMSTTGGFEAYLQSRTGADPKAIEAKAQAIVAAANEHPALTNVRTTLSTDVPRYHVALDREKAKSLDVPVDAVYEAMQSTFGALYVNDFTLYGRNYQVNLQSEPGFRQGPENLADVFVRSRDGAMVPLASLVDVERTAGADLVERFNVFPAAKLMGDPAPGYSSGQAVAAMQTVTDEAIGEDFDLAWVGSAYQQQRTGATAQIAFVFGVIMVFLILAAQYERWTLPLAVVTAVPFALFGALLAVWLRGLTNGVYFQVGLLVLIGLAAKNAILIVEFAVLQRAEGLGIREAALEAAKLRFRPIVMTSLAFILGCVPLALSTGAGAASRHSIGTGVIGGMLGATVLAIFFVPLFYQLIEAGSERLRRRRSTPQTHKEAGAHA